MNIFNVYFWKDENKQKEVENGPILKFWVYQWWRIEPNAIQCNQIGRILKVLATNLATNVAQVYLVTYLAILKHQF